MQSNLTLLQAEQLAQRVMDYCDALAKFTQTEGIIDRRYLTHEHRRTNDQLAFWAQEHGLEHWQDAAGNQWVRLPAVDANAKRLIMGSHTDTVPDGGRYDGMLGVIAPLVLLQHFAAEEVKFDVHLDVVGFGDEEGTRFGCTLLGSSAVAGSWQTRWRELKDGDGVSLARAMHDFGLDVSKVSTAQVESGQVKAYLETHIEQGPVLEERDQPLAAVKGIAGARRVEITLSGHAGHAGTVPMKLRHDPLVIASTWISEVYQRALDTEQQDYPVVATVGRLEVSPGAVNVIPGKVMMSLDIRSLSDPARDDLLQLLQQSLEEQASSHGLTLSWRETHNAGAVMCNQQMTNNLNAIIQSQIGRSEPLVSGAGHDAMVFAPVVPTSMLFVRCKGGVSHHPDESIRLDDVASTLSAIEAFILTQ